MPRTACPAERLLGVRRVRPCGRSNSTCHDLSSHPSTIVVAAYGAGNTAMVEIVDFRFGSKCDLTAQKRHFRSPPRNGHLQIGSAPGEQAAKNGSRLFGQMKPTAHLPLNHSSGTFGDFLVSCSVQSYSYGEVPAVLPNKLNATNGFTSGPLFDGRETFLSKVCVTHQRCFEFSHEKNRF